MCDDDALRHPELEPSTTVSAKANEYTCVGGVRIGTNLLDEPLIEELGRFLDLHRTRPKWLSEPIEKKVMVIGRLLGDDIYNWCEGLRKRFTGPEVEVMDNKLQNMLKPLIPAETLYLQDEAIRYVLKRLEYFTRGYFFFGGCVDLSTSDKFQWPVNHQWDRAKAAMYGFVFGSAYHWVALFIRVETFKTKAAVEYFDSFGTTPDERMMEFITLAVKAVEALHPSPVPGLYRNARFSSAVVQRDAWQCGTYVIHFLARKVEGLTFKEVEREFQQLDIAIVRSHYLELRHDLRDPYNQLDGRLTLVLR